MSDSSPTKALNHVRAAALAAALVPLAQIVATPVTLSANDSSGCPECVTVPEGGSIVPMAAAAALFIGYLRSKK